MNSTFAVSVASILVEAENILSFELHPLPSQPVLPAFTPGAHIDVHLSNGMIRSYSLLNDPGETHRYVIAVNLDAAGRGGSRFLHEQVRVGDVLQIDVPRNNFGLDEHAPHSVFIAGGIGITPLWSMVQRLTGLGASWELHYATRSRARCAFLPVLRAVGRDRLHLFFDDEAAGRRFDVKGIIEGAPAGSHFYCCGPLPMLAAFEEATAGLPPSTLHVEYFSSKGPASVDEGFEVELARSGRTVPVKAGETILDALLDSGIVAPYSCREGICGSCEVKVIEGIPDHRDLVLNAAERESNATIFICCSGAKTSRLVLDL